MFSERNSESGAVSTLLLVLFTSGFVLALLALVVDSGSLYLQRTLAQTRAEQVAVAMAKLCSNPVALTDCQTAGATAIKLNTILASTNAQVPAELLSVCASADAVKIRSSLPVCGESNHAIECAVPNLGVHPKQVHWVRAYVKVVTAATSTGLYLLVSGLGGGPAQVDVVACGQYAWGTANEIAVANSVLPLAVGPCHFSAMNVVAQLNDAANSTCSIFDLNGRDLTAKLHGTYRFEAGATTGPCALGGIMRIGSVLCLSNKTLTQTGVYYPNTLLNAVSTAYTTQSKTLLPVIAEKNASTVTDGTKGTFTTATVLSFIELKIRGYKTGATTLGIAPTNGWATACATAGNLCVNAQLTPKLSTTSPLAVDTAYNFGVSALSPID